MKMTVRLDGTKTIRRKLRQIINTTRASVVTAALESGGEVIAEEARRLVPVRSGNLRDSIGVATGGLNYSALSLKKGGISVQVGPRQGRGEPHDGFYGHMVEFGTVNMAPQPFMRPAFDSMSGEAMQVIIEHLGGEFQRLARS